MCVPCNLCHNSRPHLPNNFSSFSAEPTDEPATEEAKTDAEANASEPAAAPATPPAAPAASAFNFSFEDSPATPPPTAQPTPTAESHTVSLDNLDLAEEEEAKPAPQSGQSGSNFSFDSPEEAASWTVPVSIAARPFKS